MYHGFRACRDIPKEQNQSQSRPIWIHYPATASVFPHLSSYREKTAKVLLDEINDVELSKIDTRSDGEVEVIDVKLNNRKTKKTSNKKFGGIGIKKIIRKNSDCIKRKKKYDNWWIRRPCWV